MIRAQLDELVAGGTLKVVEFAKVDESEIPVGLCSFMRLVRYQFQKACKTYQEHCVSQREEYLEM